MNLKKVFSGCLVLLLVGVLSACGSEGVSGGTGKIIELDIKETESFQKDEKTGFIYVTSRLEVDKEDIEATKEALQHVGKQAEVDFYLFDEFKHKDFVRKLTGLDQSGLTLAFYEGGKKKEELDIASIDKEDFQTEIEKFVQDVKENHLE